MLSDPKLLLLNVRSINKYKTCDILLDMSKFKNIEILCLTELWKTVDSIYKVYFEGYELVSS